MSTKDRNDTVDTIRAVLVFSVMLYHFTVRWKGENLYNFDGSFSSRLHYGSLGVDLFFIISGFFVVHTLTSAGTAFVFIKKRVLRLYPALIVAAVITLVITALIGPPQFTRSLEDYFFSISLVLPKFLYSSDARLVDGAYWSLVVEMKFYLWVAALFFIMKWRFWVGLIAVAAAGNILGLVDNGLPQRLFLSPYMHLFLFGIAGGLYSLRNDRTAAAIIALAAIAFFICNFHNRSIAENAIIVIGTACISWLVLADIKIQAKPIAYLGVISYEIYLIHQNVGVSLIRWFNDNTSLPDLASIVVATATCVGLAALVNLLVRAAFKWASKPKREIIRNGI
ncbi:acyltransferase family protein [Agrobacterium cavarae]|uniref:acyltransferase family protein n=1 Tax=Agrobacterium cavarae TaxID=2528239 RepID=UPI0028A9CB94|nr:acyltransferase [Agrobacterium cavarae]